jgi:hypothetical protein
MAKSRPDLITLDCPDHLADAYEAFLKERLHANAKLKKVPAAEGRTSFHFYPTKSEYFLIALLGRFVGQPKPEHEKGGVHG